MSLLPFGTQTEYDIREACFYLMLNQVTCTASQRCMGLEKGLPVSEEKVEAGADAYLNSTNLLFSGGILK